MQKRRALAFFSVVSCFLFFLTSCVPFQEFLLTVNRNGTYFQVGDHVRIKRIQETGTINATDGGVVYVFLDATNGTNLFSAYVDEDAYIELVTARGEATLLQGEGYEETWSVDVQQPRVASSANVLERLLLREERRGDIL